MPRVAASPTLGGAFSRASGSKSEAPAYEACGQDGNSSEQQRLQMPVPANVNIVLRDQVYGQSTN